MDVIFHLIENKVFKSYIEDIFKMSSMYVIIYSTNFSEKLDCFHQVNRQFTKYIDENVKKWKLIKYYKNALKDENTMSDFYIYKNNNNKMKLS